MRIMHSLKITLVALLLVLPLTAQAQERLRMATTTSTENSGLLGVLNPVFEQKHDAVVDVIAVGTGKALKLGENGDVDIVFVHAPKAEKQFVENGYGIDRAAVMHNDFVIIGPPDDPAGIAKTGSAVEAMKKLHNSDTTFVSRGDDSGTHKKEKSLWDSAGVEPSGDWYLAVGQGMGAVLQIADDRQAYALTDRGTYIAYQGKINLEIVSAGDQALYNPYHIIAVNPDKHSQVKYELARDYIEFVTGKQGQGIIKDYRMKGQQLFYPDAMPDI